MASNKFLDSANKWKNPENSCLDTSSNSVSESVLLFSSGNEIFALDTDNSAKKIAERESRVFSICSHNGVIYDSEENGIFEVVTGKEIKRFYSKSIKICSHKDNVYYEDYFKIHQLFDRQSVAERSEIVKGFKYTRAIALCSYNGKLYDGGNYERVFETFENKVVAVRDSTVRALCVHEGVLYDASGNNIFKTFTGNKVASRSTFVHDLCSHNNELYDCFRNKIVKTLENKIVYESERDIWAIFSHPRNYFVEKRILK